VLNENDVVLALRDYVEAAGWTIEKISLSHQHGPDLLAARDGERLLVEAKGATSSKTGSPAYGRPYASEDVKIYVAEALYTACAGVGSGSYWRVAIAFQDDPLHRGYVEPLIPALERLAIGVFWVAPGTRAVSLEAAWRL
jgi:hypothetical protein